MTFRVVVSISDFSSFGVSWWAGSSSFSARIHAAITWKRAVIASVRGG